MSEITETIKRDNGRIVVCRSQDVSAYLEQNRRDRAEQAGGWRRTAGKNGRMVADVPNIVVEQWLKQGFNMFQVSERELRKKLDEPEWSYLKTIPGRIGQRSRHI